MSDAHDMSAEQFARALHRMFDDTRERGDATNSAGEWSKHVFPMLARIAERHDLWWAGGNTEPKQSRRGEAREYLWDFTLYHPDKDGLWNLPRVIIEHENAHDLDSFRLDHWKTLCGVARLRVAIGYVGATMKDQRHEWVEAINAAAKTKANAWHFPPDTEDLIALGYYGMTTSGNYEFWRRRNDEREWTPLTIAASAA